MSDDGSLPSQTMYADILLDDGTCHHHCSMMEYRSKAMPKPKLQEKSAKKF
jgi:hypothetical protein